jgi:hypothetical protein
MALNATFNNISVISWQSVLLMEETRVPGENHWNVASHWQTLSLYTPRQKSWHHMHIFSIVRKLCFVTTSMRYTLQFQIKLSKCILMVYHVFILYHIVVINIIKNSIWRLKSLITTCLLIWRHTLANERTCYIVFDVFFKCFTIIFNFSRFISETLQCCRTWEYRFGTGLSSERCWYPLYRSPCKYYIV